MLAEQSESQANPHTEPAPLCFKEDRSASKVDGSSVEQNNNRIIGCDERSYEGKRSDGGDNEYEKCGSISEEVARRKISENLCQETGQNYARPYAQRVLPKEHTTSADNPCNHWSLIVISPVEVPTPLPIVTLVWSEGKDIDKDAVDDGKEGENRP